MKRDRPWIATFVLLFILSGCVGDQFEKRDSTRSIPSLVILNISEDLKKELKSEPYVSWVSVEEYKEVQKGVIKHDTNLSYKGINIYNSRPRNKAYLIDMDGKILHSWSSNISPGGWQDIEMGLDGSLLVIIKDKILLKLDWNSNIEWVNELRFHHDIRIAPNGNIYSIIRDKIWISYDSQIIPILNDYIIILSQNGKVKKRISIFDLLGEKISKSRFLEILETSSDAKENIMLQNTPFDVFHTNSIQIIERNINGVCKKGDILISIRELNIIVIIDMDNEEVVWSWGEDDLDGPHHPSLLENGNILIFDNGRYTRNYTRIIELNPATKQIEWEYKAETPESFYTRNSGSSQRLPNENILITDTKKGRVFEITRQGETVWEFYNPDINSKKGKRAVIYRMERLDLSLVNNLIEIIGNQS